MKLYKELNDLNWWGWTYQNTTSPFIRYYAKLVLKSGSYEDFIFRLSMGSGSVVAFLIAVYQARGFI